MTEISLQDSFTNLDLKDDYVNLDLKLSSLLFWHMTLIIILYQDEKNWKHPLSYPNCTPSYTDEAHRHTGEVALLGHTGHTVTNGVLGVSVCLIFFSFIFLKKNDEEEQ